MERIFKSYEGWSLERISRHVLYWGLLAAFYITMNATMLHVFSFSQWVTFEFMVLPVKIGCSYTIAYWVMPRFLYRKQYVAFLIVGLITFLTFSYLLLLLYREVIYPYVLNHPIYYGFYHDIAYSCLELLQYSSFVMSIKFFQNVLKQRELSHALRQEKVQTELRFLKNQVQPHFLFNTLNNLYGMVLSKDKHSADAIVMLSDMLSYMLYESDESVVPLQKELTHLENYIKLERLRYNRKLSLNYDFPEAPEDYYIAPHLLIPFVENAFKHGPAKEEGRSQIDIQIGLSGKKLNMVVKNTYNDSEMDQSIQSGIGLANVKKRLELLYPSQYELNIKKEALFEIELILDLKEVAKMVYEETPVYHY